MTDFLGTMQASSARRAAVVQYSAVSPDRPVRPLQRSGFDLIAEIKERSPAEGDLSGRQVSRCDRARAYAKGGAVAISVLTEPERFAGELEHLAEVADAVEEFGIPVMRKDFLVAPVQIDEARAAGASGVLLIAALLDDNQLPAMLDRAFELELFVLLESFDMIDLQRTATLLGNGNYRQQAASDQLLVGVNARDLRTLHVDPQRLRKFAPALPAAAVAVAESGLQTPRDAAEVASLGYRIALVGSALMKSAEPQSLIEKMLAAGRGEDASQ